MKKWYESPLLDDGVILSSRIRLARNLKDYPFPIIMDTKPELLEKMTGEITRALVGKDTGFESIVVDDDITKVLCLLEKRCLSPEFVKKQTKKNLLLNSDESVSIMLCEEDHIRLQAILAGDKLDEAYTLADKTDDLIEDRVDYAYDKDYGYLTSCPTNVGTGMRASYMLHFPALEAAGRLQVLFTAISKLGMTARGMYGEGSKPLGSIYQISCQTTMGKNEYEIIAALKGVAAKLIEQEEAARNSLFEDALGRLEDRIYRSYGTLMYARRLTLREAMSYLSDLRLGLLSGKLDISKPQVTIYSLMMGIQQGNLQSRAGRELDENERDYARAEYIRAALS